MRSYRFRDGGMGMGTSVEARGNRKAYRESDQPIVPQKPRNAGRWKELTKHRHQRPILMQTGAEKRWCMS